MSQKEIILPVYVNQWRKLPFEQVEQQLGQFGRSIIFQLMANGPKWSEMLKSRPDGTLLLPGADKWKAKSVPIRMLMNTGSNARTTAELLEEMMMSDWPEILSDHAKVRAFLVTAASIRYENALERLKRDLRIGDSVDYDQVQDRLALVNRIIMARDILDQLDFSKDHCFRMRRLRDELPIVCNQSTGLVDRKALLREMNDEDWILMQYLRAKVKNPTTEPLFQENEGAFNPHFTHCSGRTVSERFLGQLMAHFLVWMDPLTDGLVLTRQR